MTSCKFSESNRLIIVVALAPEAKAIRSIGQWHRLEKTPGAPICYQRDDKPILMIVTGSGKVASAIGTAWILEKYQAMGQSPNIINIGLAGADDAAIGSLWWVNKVTDDGSSKSWYPQQDSKNSLPKMALQTFDVVQSTYPEQALVDMEASGFMQAACQWSSVENIAIVKCISDNSNHSSDGLKPQDVVALLNYQREMIETVFDESLEQASKRVASTPAAIISELWYQRWHFSCTQKIALQKHLQALALFMPGEEAMFLEACTACNNATDVLACLEAIRQQTHGQLFHV